jgi:hypothetical protein
MARHIPRRPPRDWPDPDRELWIMGVEPKGLFQRAARVPDGPTIPGYGCWLKWLATQGLGDPNLCPAERVTRECVGAYVGHFRAECAPYAVLCPHPGVG